MHSDSYFCIGASHRVCQDYALSGVTEDGRAYAIVADGCSGSPDTDFGARFMAKSTQWALNQTRDANSPFVTATAYAQQMVSSCNMKYECLDSTVLCAVEANVYGHRGVQVSVAGDGVIVARCRNSTTLDVGVVEFESGFPAYASYMLDLPRMLRYIEHANGGLATISVEDGHSGHVVTDHHKFYAPEAEWFRPYSIFLDADAYDLVLLLSDGALSFQELESGDTSKRAVPVKLARILNELTQFKNMKGEFVVRRLRKFLTKTCAENKWSHYDDLSVAAIYMD